MPGDSEKQRLLREVLQEENEADAHAAAAARRQVLAAFRQGHQGKRLARIALLAAVAVVPLAGILILRGEWTKPRTHPEPGAVVARPATRSGGVEEVRNRTLPTLTDAQLLASFPPGTCYLAEVDGRKILVFTDANVGTKYLH